MSNTDWVSQGNDYVDTYMLNISFNQDSQTIIGHKSSRPTTARTQGAINGQPI